MSRKIKIILLIVLGILVIAGLVGGAYWLGTKKTRKQEESKTLSYPSAWTEESDNQTKDSIKNQIDPTSLEYETWNADKEGLTLKYPKSWIKSEIRDMSQVATKEEIDKYKLSLPLLVSFPSAEKLLQITVTRYEFSSNNKIKEIINTLIEEAQKKVASITVIDQKNNERVLVMENKYKKDDLELHTKEKLILLTAQGDILPGYIISFSSLEKDWLEYEKLIGYVIDSAILTDGSITNISSNLN